MERKYFALFLNGVGYIEKCISLIRYINNPKTTSFPHITVRFIYDATTGNKYLEKAQVNYLNIIQPNVFNNDNNTHTVFLQCESDDLAELEYKYDYPFSRLHITLYDGIDSDYANKLLILLSSIQWNVKLSFNPAKKLTENVVGSKKTDYDFERKIKDYWDEFLNDTDFDSFDGEDKKYNLYLIERIINKLNYYLLNHNSIKNVVSCYNDNYRQINHSVLYNVKHEDMYKLKARSNYITPPEYAKEMAKLALDYFDFSDNIFFGDSSIGTGNLFFALKRALENYNIKFDYIVNLVSQVIDDECQDELLDFQSFKNLFE